MVDGIIGGIKKITEGDKDKEGSGEGSEVDKSIQGIRGSALKLQWYDPKNETTIFLPSEVTSSPGPSA